MDKKLKVVAFRPTKKEQAIIDKYMKDHNLKNPTEAMKHMVNAISSFSYQQGKKLEQKPHTVASMYLPQTSKRELPYDLQEELNRFLRGQTNCPTIKAILNLNPNSKILTILP